MIAARWVAGSGAVPLHERLLRFIQVQPRVFCDETPLLRLDPGLGRTKLWAYVYTEGLSVQDLLAHLSGFGWLLPRYRFNRGNIRTHLRAKVSFHRFSHHGRTDPYLSGFRW